MFTPQSPLEQALAEDADGALAIGRQVRALVRKIEEVHSRHWSLETELLLGVRNHNVTATEQKGASTLALAEASNAALDTLCAALEAAGRSDLAKDFRHRAPTSAGRDDIVYDAEEKAYVLVPPEEPAEEPEEPAE